MVVGGRPAGCSTGVFTGRYGLDTVTFDRGRSSIQRCAHLENYLCSPTGIGIETLYDPLHDHATEAGCALVPDLVESVDQTDGGEGFVVTPQEGDPVTTRQVVAARQYDGEHLRALDEPTTFLNLRLHLEELEIIETLRDENDITVIVVLHDIQQSARHDEDT